MGRKTRKNFMKRFFQWALEHKIAVILIALVFVIILTTFGAKLMLYLRLALGNDIIVKLDVNKNNFYLVHGEEGSVEFEAEVVTNPFCKAFCSYSFADLSMNNAVENANFTLRPTTPFKKEYSLSPPKNGAGLLLYRFDMECYSTKTILCHTKGEPSTRSILVTVNYDLNEEEKRMKENLKERIENLKKGVGYLQGQLTALRDISNKLNKTISSKKAIFDDGPYLVALYNELYDLRKIWGSEDYELLMKETTKAEQDYQEALKFFAEWNSSLSSLINSYNGIIEGATSNKDDLKFLQNITIINITKMININTLTEEFNAMLEYLHLRDDISKKIELQQDISGKVEFLKSEIDEYTRKESIRLQIEINTNYDLLCAINNQCVTHVSISELSNTSDFELNKTCNNIEELKEAFRQVNKSIYNDFLAQNYPSSDEFWNNTELELSNIREGIILKYLDELPNNNKNTDVIRELLLQPTHKETLEYPEYNLTYALLFELVNLDIKSCDKPNISLIAVGDINLTKIEINDVVPLSIGIGFEEQLPKCCVFGECNTCCLTQTCKDNSSTFPVVFLHGHAIDKATSAEYSLEGFNKIQERMEQDGYLNAGTVTLYSLRDIPPGIWGMPRVPLTIRASYYFDVFGQPENYVVVQTKSENIDTYSVRLKELIDLIKYKTGKPKVNIIAFSMGGLVARRYMQIFGTEGVNKVILVATPNKGIVGGIANYCPIVGENLECRDMDSKSLFINKLNREPVPDAKIYNIVGTGCKMKEGLGDGTVLEQNALLDGAENYLINGTCPSLAVPLHLTIRDIDLYPEVYDIIIGALQES